MYIRCIRLLNKFCRKYRRSNQSQSLTSYIPCRHLWYQKQCSICDVRGFRRDRQQPANRRVRWVHMQALPIGRCRSQFRVAMDKQEYRAVIKFLQKKGLNAREIFKELHGVYGELSPSERTVERWVTAFWQGQDSFEDDPRSSTWSEWRHRQTSGANGNG